MKLACTYARRSTDDQEGSLPAQCAQMKAFAKRNGYKLVDRYEDDGISGTSLNRPGLKALMRAAAKGARWQHILVWDRSRLGRPEDPREAIAVTFELERHGKTITPLHGTPQTDNPVINTILEALEFGQAGEESIRKSRDVLRGHREAAKKVSVPVGRPPYGYDAIYLLNGEPVRRMRYLEDGSKHRLSVDGKQILGVISRGKREGKSPAERRLLAPGDPKRIDVVRRIFLAVCNGESPRRVAKQLNAESIQAPRGGAWGRSTIRRTVQNPAYKGTLAWNQQSWGKFHKASSDGEIVRISNPSSRWKRNPQEAWVIHEESWEGLVSKSKWEKANKALNIRSKPPALRGRAKESPFLASGLLVCTCGAHFTGSGFKDKRRKGHRYEYYRCLGASDKGRAICTVRRVRRGIVDDYLERRVRQLFFEPALQAEIWDMVAEEFKTALSQVNIEDHVEQAQKRLAEVKGQIQRLVGAVAAGALEATEIEARVKPLRKERDELRRTLASNLTKKGNPRDPKKLYRDTLDNARQLLKEEEHLWRQNSPGARKQIVRAHVASVTLDEPRSRLVTEFYPLVSLPEFGVALRTDSSCVPHANQTEVGVARLSS